MMVRISVNTTKAAGDLVNRKNIERHSSNGVNINLRIDKLQEDAGKNGSLLFLLKSPDSRYFSRYATQGKGYNPHLQSAAQFLPWAKV